MRVPRHSRGFTYLNQSVRHVHTNRNATFSEIRACHDLLKGLKQDVLDALTAELPSAGERAS